MMKKIYILIALIIAFVLISDVVSAQLSTNDKKYSEIANYDESKVPEYMLPDVLLTNDGEKVTTVKEWETIRRPEVLEMLTTYMYGKTPGRPADLHWNVKSVDKKALDGRATRKEITIYFTKGDTAPCINLLLYLPNNQKGRIPLFLGISFFPNFTVYDDPGIEMPEMPANSDNKRRFPMKKGMMKDAWQLDYLFENGYGLATFCYSDIDPDFDDDFKNGVQPLFYKKGQTYPKPDEWGSVAAWAWGMSRAMDYIETDKDIDSKRVAVIGHSRLGKTATWAGASDQRFAMVFSCNSGCCGVALSKRIFGETIEAMNVRFPHHFDGNYKQFNGREKYMPFDQHELVALVAPRPIYIASAGDDNWADQKGEFLGGKGAEPVYALYGLPGIGVDSQPAIDVAVHEGYIGYHNRTGPHAVLRYDWEQFIQFANMHYKINQSKK